MATQRNNCGCGGLYQVRGGRLVCGTCGKPSPVAVKPPPGPVAGAHNHVITDDLEALCERNELETTIRQLRTTIAEMQENDKDLVKECELAEAALLPAFLALRSGQNKWKPPVDWLEGVKAILERAGLIDEQGRPIIREPAATPVLSDVNGGAAPVG